MTREEFRKRWESNNEGGGITFDDIANCAISWGLYQSPRIHDINLVRYRVLKEANCIDAEKYKC